MEKEIGGDSALIDAGPSSDAKQEKLATVHLNATNGFNRNSRLHCQKDSPTAAFSSVIVFDKATCR